MPYDWTENQTIPGIAINPGTGPVHGASQEQAAKNIEAFVNDVNTDDRQVEGWDDTGKEDEGRWVFVLHYGDRESTIDMPGLPLDEVRYLGPPQNIWDYPRLYENGSSWVWCYAIDAAQESLWGEDDDS
jgi:hypothetical protein